MPKIGTILLHGKSGNSYQFNIYPIGASFKKLAGVYAVTRHYKNEKGTYTHHVVYVGETGDLSERFENHHKAECFKEHEATCICIHAENDEDVRLVIEQDMIDYYKPDCND